MPPPQRQIATLTEIISLGSGLGRVVLSGQGLGAHVTCGSFAMVEAPGRPDCILLRPFSYFTADGPDSIGLLIKDLGKGTQALLNARPGDPIVVFGPLGSRFPEPPERCWIVAGGVGAAPFGLLKHRPGLHVLFGARTVAESGFARALEERGANVILATDDGSSGFRGNVVQLLEHQFATQPAPEAIYTCGPSAMMAATAASAKARNITCWASLEERMGCGIGICRGCAHRDAVGAWRCICVDGPVYNAAEIFP